MAYKNSICAENSISEYPIIEDNTLTVEPPSGLQLSDSNERTSIPGTESDVSVFNPPATNFFVKAPDGENIGYVSLTDALGSGSVRLTKTLDVASNTRYTFSVDVSNPTNTKEQEIAALFDKWNAALQTGNPDEVVKLYAKDGVLLPTLSNKVRVTHSQMRDYFKHFLKYEPKGSILQQNIRVINNFFAINSGVYSFNLIKNHKPEKVVARYSFVYHHDGNDWLIVDHHSSAMPEI
ncbi:SgcJ/EcaC family oxidoreductase [Scytonema hofmannii]|uniref:SgcJ/EcaC family oxidoreductase n=1 Tax=Scytonema hofmannii TaxID=34078 RepID=UPI000347C1AF|nr:SgcJ/EcaC family oxidoreductase [Scytonema hofmannii]